MPDIETLRSLLARVEVADGADRELDGRIWAATAGVTILEWDGDGVLWKDEHGGLRHQRDDRIPAYTASIDAVVALVERVLPSGWTRVDVWNTDDVKQVTASVLPLPVPNSTSSGKAATAPLALLSALLKALIAREEAHVV